MKEYLCRTYGYPIEDQRLIFAGRQLSDDYSMSRSRLSVESTVHLILKTDIRNKPTVLTPITTPINVQQTKRNGNSCIVM